MAKIKWDQRNISKYLSYFNQYENVSLTKRQKTKLFFKSRLLLFSKIIFKTMTKFEYKRMGKCKQNENKIRYLRYQ